VHGRNHTPAISIEVLLLAIGALLATTSGCGRPGGPGGGAQLTSTEIQSQLSVEPPPTRERFNSSLAEKRRYVEGLLRTRALVDEARRRGLDKDPLVVRRTEQVLVDRLLEKLRGELAPGAVTDAEIDAYLSRQGKTSAPQKRTRVSQIVLASRAEAESVRASLEKLAPSAREPRFREEARARSLDRASAEHAGDAGYLGKGMAGVPEVLALAAEALGPVGDLSPPIAHVNRFVLLLKTGELGPPTLPAEVARRQARMRLLDERRQRALEAIVERGGGKRKLDSAFLEKLRAPLEASTARR